MSLLKTDKYDLTIDLLRIISILSVVLIHVSTRDLEFDSFNLSTHFFTLFLNQVTRFAVPLFFLISAFVLELNFPQNFNYLIYLKKRFRRLFLPYLFWSAIYYFFIYLQHSKSFFQVLLTGDASYQLYFIPTLFIFYLIFPLIHHYYSILTSKKSLIFLGIIQIILLSFDYYFHIISLPYPFSVLLFNFYVFILGMFFSHHQSDITNFVFKYKNKITLSLIFLSILITSEGYLLYKITGNYLSFYSQWRPSILLYTLLIFVYFYSYFSQKKLNQSLIYFFASRAFFVFFIHVIVLESIWKYLPHLILSFTPLYFIVVTSLSYFLAFIVSKIPYLSKLTA